MTEWQGWQPDLDEKRSTHKHCAEVTRMLIECIRELRTAVETIWHELDESRDDKDNGKGSWFGPWH